MRKPSENVMIPVFTKRLQKSHLRTIVRRLHFGKISAIMKKLWGEKEITCLKIEERY